MSVRKEFERISKIEDEIGVLTLYLNTDASSPELNNGEWKIHLKNEIKEMKNYADKDANDEEKKVLKKLLKQFEDRVSELQMDLHKGLVITASADGELWEERNLQVPVTTTLHWEKTPATKQFEAIIQKYPNVAVIALQKTDVRFIETELGDIKEEIAYSWDFESESWLDYNNDSPPGSRGSGQDHFERRFNENKHRWYKNIAPKIGKKIKDRGLEGAYLIGSSDLVQAFEENMDKAHLSGVVYKNIGTKKSHEIVNEIYEDLI